MLIRAQLQRGEHSLTRNDPLRYCRELAHFPPAAGRPGRPVLLSKQVTIAGEVRAIEADRIPAAFGLTVGRERFRNSLFLLGTGADTILQPIHYRALTTRALSCFSLSSGCEKGQQTAIATRRCEVRDA